MPLATLVASQAGASIAMIKKALFLPGLIFLLACDPAIEESGIPNVAVNVEINLRAIDSAPLQLIGGYIYVDGGVRGIIVRRESQNEYSAFERNCPYRPQDACAIVEMNDTGFYMEDLCCGSTFDLSGFPTAGPAAFPMKKYRTTLSGDFLYIFN